MARTRAEDFEQKKHHILHSAVTVLGDIGMEKASMAMIAKHAKVSKALLYHYYSSKEDLIFGVIESHLSNLDQALENSIDPKLSAEEQLRTLIHTTLDIYRDADNYHKVQLEGLSALSPENISEIRTIERRIISRFSSNLKIINPVLDQHTKLLLPTTMSLFGMLNWMYMWFKEDGPITREQYADLATTLFLKGVLAISAPNQA